MRFETIKVGELATNCYIVEDRGEALVIDPGAETDRILEALKGLRVKAIVLTHGHYDHVTDAFMLKEMVKAPVMLHKEDETMMVYTTQQRADGLLNGGDRIKVGGEEFEVIHTPGHSRGGICLYNGKEGILFSGDTLFQGTYGRTDLPSSSQDEMEGSLRKLQELPEEVKVFPGHGRPTTIGDEKGLIL